MIDLAGESSNDMTSGVTQSVSTTIGVAYELSFYVGSATDNQYFFASTIDLSIDGGSRMSFTNSTTPGNMLDWKKFTVAFSAQNSNTSFTFYHGSGPDNYLSGLDNVSLDVTAVPEPASIAMLSTGALGLLFACRKRRQTKLAV